MHLLLLFPLLFRLSGSSADLMCPEDLRRPARSSLTVQCHYDPGLEPYLKFWCRGADFGNCTILLRTDGSRQWVKGDRVSIRDDRRRRVFTVTMEKLRQEDADTYWCGIEKNESGHGVPVKVAVGTGIPVAGGAHDGTTGAISTAWDILCSARCGGCSSRASEVTGTGSAAVIAGPEEANGPEQGSLTVPCCYAPGWELYVKYWCRGADWGNCEILVRTDQSQRGLKKGRVSIRDDSKSRVFTVTMEKLTQKDADTYWCGIERTGYDHGVPVKVSVGPATTTVSTTIPTTTTFTAPVTTEAPTGSPNVSGLHPEGRGVFTELNVLLPLLSALLLLLLVAALLLAWRIVKRRKKAVGVPPEQVLQPLDSDICYANLTLQQPGNAPSSTRKRASTKHSSSAQDGQAEVEYITMASFPKEDISYAALSLDGLDQDATYVNTGDIVTHLPSRGHEELTEYSTIMKP